uniref:non-specific serine/threonine protein kinase n=1 Tax=Kalanchoe fedtschenkoi TaxID=63787 RepID=A0A7N0THS5_KALFE
MLSNRTLFCLMLQHLAVELVLGGCQGRCHQLHRSLLTDKAALLEFKRSTQSDPFSVMANWDGASDACNFTGVVCSQKHHRVISLILKDADILGPISTSISNLTGLRVLELVNNHMFGIIPDELGYLRRLRSLKLKGNNLQGSIPSTLGFLSKLEVINLSGNRLHGSIPAFFFANCTLLTNVDLSDNMLGGNIPAEIGNCPSLWTLNLYNNQFTGGLPFSITNSSKYMFSLDVENNHLSGELPTEIVGKFTYLIYLHLSYNNMVSHDRNTNLDPFFVSLSNCTVLEELELAGLGLGGRLPNSLGKMSAKLAYLLLQENHIVGSVPSQLANLPRLVVINLTSNLLNETVSPELSHLSYLDQLFLSHNSFSTAVPSELGDFPHLGLLDLSHNMFRGEIPSSFGNLVHINYLFLNNNFLSGSIPASLGQCRELYRLDLSHNLLSGSIPPEISGMVEIRIFLNFSHNHLGGPLPLELSKLEKVQEMDLSSNNLTGTIFFQISSCIALRLLNLSSNTLQGPLPESLGELKNLESLDVSGNQLSGRIPTSLNKIQSLSYLNLSLNNFNGMVPSGGVFNSITNLSFLGNQHVCGSVVGKPVCSLDRKWFHSSMLLIIFSTGIFLSVIFAMIGCLVGIRHLRRMIAFSADAAAAAAASRTTALPEVLHNIPRISYKELMEATAGFNEENLVGSGSYGHVFKGVLSDGTAVAVKVLQLQVGNSTKSFTRECQVLKRIRHRNLIRIITACSLPNFKALVLPYMTNGSLESHLYSHSGVGGSGGGSAGSSNLSLIQRVNICSDIAEGMAYLHHHSPVKVIHCDLKPSNILLNDDMTGLVSDFGIARLVMTVGPGVVENVGNSTANMLHGSVGYIAPEYGFGSSTSTKGDVYSFGVLVLEMVTRRRPTDDMFVGGLNLHKWVKSHYHVKNHRMIIDPSLLKRSRDQSPEVMRMREVAIGELIELGILCSQHSPSSRPSMLDAADDLDRLKRYLGGDTTATFSSSLGFSSSTMDDDN